MFRRLQIQLLDFCLVVNVSPMESSHLNENEESNDVPLSIMPLSIGKIEKIYIKFLGKNGHKIMV